MDPPFSSAYLRADTLFACNAYHIGKERCYFGGALACDFRIFASPARQRTLRRLDLPQAWLALLVDDVSKADVIISDRGVAPPQLASLQEEVGRPVVGFQCTGAMSPLHKSSIKRCNLTRFTVSVQTSCLDPSPCGRCYA